MVPSNAHEDVTGAGDQRSEFVARRGAVGGKGLMEPRGAASARRFRRPRWPWSTVQVSPSTVTVYARVLRDVVSPSCGAGRAGPGRCRHSTFRDLKRVTDGVAPRGNGRVTPLTSSMTVSIEDLATP